MKNFIFYAIFCLSGSFLWAENAQSAQEAELLSAKVAYQEVLTNQEGFQKKYQDVSLRLEQAKQKLAQAQSEMQAAQQSFDQIQSEQAQYNLSLQEAGRRLDAAWAAVRNR